MIYYIVQDIIDTKQKNKNDKKLELPSKKEPAKPIFALENQDIYDFKIPKDGKVKNIPDNRFLELNNKRYKAKNYNTIISWKSRSKITYALAAPATTNNYYFANAYLNGYVPYEAKSLWQPLEVLRLRFKYEKDDILYNKRPEVWQTSRESFVNLRGDCEDHAISLADWLIGLGYDARVAIGTVKFKGQPLGGHAWVILFKDNKEYLLEATRKQKWNMLPLASSLPYYFPTEMFNREDTWTNKGSSATTKYSGEMWVKSGKFVPDNSYYPDLKRHRLFVNTEPSDATVKIINIKKEFSQGIKLRTGKYYVNIRRKGFKPEEFWVYVNSKDLHIKRQLIKL